MGIVTIPWVSVDGGGGKKASLLTEIKKIENVNKKGRGKFIKHQYQELYIHINIHNFGPYNSETDLISWVK
jgi:hypothetical protein